MINKLKRASVVSAGLLLLLPGCAIVDTIKEKVGAATKSVEKAVPGDSQAPLTGNVLLTIDGKPAISVDSFEAYFYQFLQNQPKNLKKLLPMMPDAKQNVFAAMANEEIILAWARKHHVQDQPEYKAELKQVVSMVEKRLANKFFEQEHKPKVSEGDAKKFYNENKETMPGLYRVRKGVAADGVHFDKEDAAKAFLDVVKKAAGSFDAEARKVGKTVKDFKMVTDMSMDVDNILKKRILDMSKIPSVELVKLNNKSIWVVKAKADQKAQFVPFEDVAEDIEEFLEREKMGKVYNEVLPKLRAEYNVVENKEFFDKGKPAPVVNDAPDKASGDVKPAGGAKAA